MQNIIPFAHRSVSCPVIIIETSYGSSWEKVQDPQWGIMQGEFLKWRSSLCMSILNLVNAVEGEKILGIRGDGGHQENMAH